MKEFCKAYKLNGPITEQDLDWMYASGIEIYVERPYDDNDSGWCDATTGQQILTASHKFTAFVRTDEQDTWLNLYWERRADHIFSGFSATVKYDELGI